MAKKTPATKIDGIEVAAITGETVLLWKATRELSAEEHEQLASKVRFEQEHAGIKIVLVPLSVDVELTIQTPADTAAEPTAEPVAEQDADPDDELNQGGADQ